MKDIIKISVIIPIYNQEKHLRECLETVLLQNLQEIEVICVNDGSTDGSLEFLTELAWTDERLHIITQERKGIDEARDTGIRAAKGEYLTFMEPKDKYYNFKALELLYNKAKANDAMICGGNFASHNEESDQKDICAGSEKGFIINEEKFYSYKEYQYDRGLHRFIYDRSLILDNMKFFPSSSRFYAPVFFVKALHQAKQFFGITEKVYSYGSRESENGPDKTEISDIISGISDIARIARDNRYDRLLELAKLRLIRDYSECIYPYMIGNDEEIVKKLRFFEKSSGSDDIEKEILSFVLIKRDEQLASLKGEMEMLKKGIEVRNIENDTLKSIADSQKMELKQINVIMEETLNEFKLQKKEILRKISGNILPFPYVDKSHEKDGIKWTVYEDGSIEVNGTAEKETKFQLTPDAAKKCIKTGNKRYKVSIGARDTSSFTWFISGQIIGNEGDNAKSCFLRDTTINDTDGFSESFEIDTNGYDHFGILYLKIKKGRTLDHVIFKPELYAID